MFAFFESLQITQFYVVFLCISCASTDDLQAILSEDSQSSQDESQDEYEPLTSTPRPHPDDKITIQLSRKTLFKESAEVAARCGISNRKHAALTAKIVKMGGGSLEDITLSTSSAWRQRSKGVDEGASAIKEKFISDHYQMVVLHWDGKIIKYETGTVDDRLCIKVDINQ